MYTLRVKPVWSRYDKHSLSNIKSKSWLRSFSTLFGHSESVYFSSLWSNVYPDCLKVAKVTPLFKGGDRTDVNCYRPISLLPSIGKLLENVIAEQTIEHFETHDLFSDKQYGFRKGFNTEYALLDVYEKLLNNMDRGLYSCGIFLDLAKAFDSVSHSILIRKLEKYGIRGNALELFKSYLSEGSQFVSVDNSSSALEWVLFGVPQGSILGPLLFNIFLSDIQDIFDKFYLLYYLFLCLVDFVPSL